jgi:phosphoenolpyruvate synthase/pyruvate phosphate dikinase
MSRRISFMDRLSIPSSSCSNGLGARVASGGGPESLRSTLRSSLISSEKGASTRALYDLEPEAFDSSLGCPLKNYENATLGLVGGKALQCWRLAKHGFPVPTAFIIPTYVYSLHVEKAGVAGLIKDVFKSELMNKSCRPANEAKFESIRKAIMTTPLQKEVVENLSTFLDAMKDGTRVAVRSSGSAEDLASQSFAGQYDTFLYKLTIEEVEESVKACWAR